MLTETDRQIAKEFQRRLSVITPVLDICVFGSRARGEATDDSDMDMFIELETLDSELREQIVICNKIIFQYVILDGDKYHVRMYNNKTCT